MRDITAQAIRAVLLARATVAIFTGLRVRSSAAQGWRPSAPCASPRWADLCGRGVRGRVLEGDIAARFLTSIVNLGEIRKLLSDEHFLVDGTLVEAWASQKNLKPRKGKDGDSPPASSGCNEEVEFRGRSGSNQTHASTTDPDAMLYRKGAGMEAKVCFIGHALMENRKGLLVEARLTKVSGHALRLDHRTATLVQVRAPHHVSHHRKLHSAGELTPRRRLHATVPIEESLRLNQERPVGAAGIGIGVISAYYERNTLQTGLGSCRKSWSLAPSRTGLPFKFVVEVKVRLAYYATVEPYAAEKIGHFHNPIRNTCLSAAL